MLSVIIATSLQQNVQKQLQAHCYGLPDVEWIEEYQFLISLKYMGALEDRHLLELKETLKTFSFPSFSTAVHGVESVRTHKGHGILYASLEDSEPLAKLCKEIDLICRTIGIKQIGPRQPPRITLGHHSNLNPVRLAEYLAIHHDFHIDAIPIDHINIYDTTTNHELVRYKLES